MTRGGDDREDVRTRVGKIVGRGERGGRRERRRVWMDYSSRVESLFNCNSYFHFTQRIR